MPVCFPWVKGWFADIANHLPLFINKADNALCFTAMPPIDYNPHEMVLGHMDKTNENTKQIGEKFQTHIKYKCRINIIS
jgi:hypothetical protein